MFGRFLCRIGLHRFGSVKTDAGTSFCFGLGHSYQDCERDDCTVRVRYYPWVDKP
jgi:hypothetical protein